MLVAAAVDDRDPFRPCLTRVAVAECGELGGGADEEKPRAARVEFGHELLCGFLELVGSSRARFARATSARSVHAMQA